MGKNAPSVRELKVLLSRLRSVDRAAFDATVVLFKSLRANDVDKKSSK